MPFTRLVLTAASSIVLLAGAANAQVDAQAKAALEESAKAIKESKPLTFKAKRSMEGMPMLKYGGEGQFKFLRTATPDTTLSFWAKGETEIPGEGKKNIEVLTVNGKTVTWVDEAKKTVYEQPMAPNTDGASVLFKTRTTLLPPPLVENEPYAIELKAGKIVMEPAATIAGEPCHVIRCVIKEGDAERLIYISAGDHLPRRFEQIKIMGNGKMSPVWELSDLKIDPSLDIAKLKIETPKDYTREKKEAPTAPEPKPGVPNTTGVKAPTGDVLPTGGLRVGAMAPNFDLPVAGAKAPNVTLASQRGNVVVLSFWGTRFRQSIPSLAVADEIARTYADRGVKVFAIASREESPEAVEKYLAGMKSRPTVPVLIGAQATPDAYGLRGFPSALVIDANGQVVKFFEGTTAAADIGSAIETALKSKGGADKAEKALQEKHDAEKGKDEKKGDK